MKSDFTLAFNEIVEQRALPREVVLEALAQALVSAYRRDANVSNNQRVEAKVDLTGQSEILLEKEVVESVENEQTEVTLEEAHEREPEAQLGDTVMVPVRTTRNFGRIAAQTAKQVILQRIREAERESLYDEFVEREGDLVTGTVQSVTSGAITLSLGRAEAVMPRAQQIPGERYRPHDKVRAYVMEVKKNSRGPQIILSRAHKNMLRRLLEYEVPEIYNGQVEIKNIAREAGDRSKVAVAALQEGVDPVGACVGMRGIRIQNIVKELNDEKIDVIEWSPDPAVFIAKSLSPARVSDMLLEEDLETGRTATVMVPDDQLSLAIGRQGQNARLAAKLTGWRIDIKNVSEAAIQAFERLDTPPLSMLYTTHPDLIADVTRIVEKKRANRPLQPEEYQTLTEFAKLAERTLLEVRESERDERRSVMDMVRSLVPARAFEMKIEELELHEDINKVLARLENVGELMVRMLADEEALGRMLVQGNAGEDALEAIRYALDDLVILGEEEAQAAAEAAEAAEAIEVPETAEAAATPGEIFEPEPAAAEVEEAPVAALDVEAEEEVLPEELPPAFVEPEPEPEPERAPVGVRLEPVLQPEPSEDDDAPRRKPRRETAEPVPDEEEVELEDKPKRGKKKKRQFVYDEDRGEVVAKRRRKGSRARGEWDEYLD